MSKPIELFGGPLDGSEILIEKPEIRIALRTAPIRWMAIYRMNKKTVRYQYAETVEYKGSKVDLHAEPTYYATDPQTLKRYTMWKVVEKIT